MRLLLLCAGLAITMISQAQQITGTAKDESGAAISGATVSLMKIRDSIPLKLAVTKADGSYQFTGIKEGQYKLMVTYVGYKPVVSESFSFTSSGVHLPAFQLTKTPGTMSNVNVAVKKPLVEVKADKTIMNVEGTINATGSNALELLRKSPGVLMDKDDNLSLAGKNGVQVYIDGKQTPLSAQDLANYLKSIQSAQIEAIELITNPSAKYDAAGNAGIINIRLVRNKALGTNGSLNAGWNHGYNAKYNAGFALNHRNKNINLFSSYNYSYSPTESRVNFTRSVADSLFEQNGAIQDKRKTHNFKAGADYFISKKQTIGVMVNGTLADPVSSTLNKTYISQKNSNNVSRILQADNDVDMKRHNVNINLNYNYVDPKGKNLSINADKGMYNLQSDQMQRNYYYDATGQLKLDEIIYHMLAPADIDINTLKADYEQNYKKGKLSIGAKTAFIKTDNDFQRYNVTVSGEEIDRDRSNKFIYDENINAGYVNYNRQYKKYMIQAGLRVEHTNTEGISHGQKWNGSSYEPNSPGFSRSYTDFFPSASLTFNKNKMKQWSFTYSRRIDRPAYQDLNPFEFKMDEYTFMKGNVNLRPQYTNSFGITHTYKFKLNMTLNYSHINDMFTQIFDTIERTKAFISKRNLATQDVVSFNLSYPFSYKSYSLFTNISSNYSRYRADFGPGRLIELDAFAFNLFAQNSLKFKKTWTAELSGFYNAPTIYMGSFKGRAMYSMDAGISKQCMEGRLSMKASVSDVFRTMQFRATSDFAGQTMRVHFRPESRQLKLSMAYRFGSNTVKPARQRATGAEDELKRVQQSSGMGIGN